jgi:predicted DNA-binding protein with PD1-like motif
VIGDIAMGDDGKPGLHAHCILGLSDGSVRGGHFLSGKVRPTLEIVVTGAAGASAAPETIRTRHRSHRSYVMTAASERRRSSACCHMPRLAFGTLSLDPAY